GYVGDKHRRKLVPLNLNVKNLRPALKLPEHDIYDATPSDDELIEFLKFLSYSTDDNKPLVKRGDFRRKGLPPMWNMLFSIINCCLNGKVGSPDQSSHAMLSIMYGIYFGLDLDFAGLIFEDMVGLIRKKVATQNQAKRSSSSSSHHDGNPKNLILQRFFGLAFHDTLKEQLPWSSSDKSLAFAKLYPMKSFKPTIHDKGYRQIRPMSHAMIMWLPKTHRDEYRRRCRRPKPVLATPLRIGQPKESKIRKIKERSEE